MTPCRSHDVYKDCQPCDDCPPAPNAIALPPCADGEPCEEILDADCVVYNGPNLPSLGILDNDRLATILIKLHQIHTPYNNTIRAYTATALTAVPYVIDFLALGPVYKSTPGATSAGTVITVGSTTGLVVGMAVEVTAGTGHFLNGTIVVSLTPTTFTVSQDPDVPLSGINTVVTGTGSTHTAFQAIVIQGQPQTFNAFTGSPVIVSGQGTIV